MDVNRVRASATLACALALSLPAAAGATPVPQVTGPLPVTATSYPFGAADHQLVPQDLAQDRLRRGGVPGQRQGQRLQLAGAGPGRRAHAGRALHHARARAPPGEGLALQRQRRRRDPQPVQPVRPQHRLGARARASSSRNGDAWVGVTGKPISVDALKNFDPVRYGSLSFANPLPLERSRATATRRSRSSRRPRARPRTGWSTTSPARSARGCAAATRSNPLTYGKRHGLAGGPRLRLRLLADRQLPSTTTSTRSSRSSRSPTAGRCSTATSSPSPAAASSAPPRSTSASRRRRTATRASSSRNAGTPIIHMMSQSDYLTGIDARRPDSDAPPGPLPPLRDGRRRARDARRAALLGRARGHREGRPRRAADELQRGPAQPLPEQHLLRRGAAQPRLVGAPRASRRRTPTRSSSPARPAPVLDEFGNVQGGLRSPYLDVPTSTWFASSTPAPRSAASPGTRCRSPRSSWPRYIPRTGLRARRHARHRRSGRRPAADAAGRPPHHRGGRPRRCALSP